MLSIIGQVIRQIREENDITPEEVAARVGISVERLIEIETNRVRPSLRLLIKLSRALGARVNTVMGGDEAKKAIVTHAIHDLPQRADNGESQENGNLRMYPLASDKENRHMEPLLVIVAPQSSLTTTEPNRSEHDGEEFLYVLDGTIVLSHGNETYELHAGDSIYYDSDVPHRLTNPGDTPARLLATLYTPY